MTEKSGYKEIFLSTALFSFVKLISIVVRIVINKAVAVLLGTQGMGIIGMFYSSTDIIRAISGLGISQSAVRDVSNAYSENNREKFSRVIGITKRIIILTGLLGALVTILFSPLLSKWSFGSYNYTGSFILLGIFTFASIVNEGQTAIIRGVRNLKALARTTVFGAFTGLILGVPLYYFLGDNGIVPSMTIVSLSSMAFSWWLVSKIDYEKLKISLIETLTGSREMIKLGITLTYVAFLGLISEYLMRVFIAGHGSLEQVGIFQAGVVMLTSYFGIVLTALNTDYYPRMFAVAHDNIELKKQMNIQVYVSFMMLTPILFIFIILMPLIVKILYTNKFLDVINYLQFAIFGLLINVYTDSLGVVLIAKQESKLLAITVSAYRIITIPLLIMGYYFAGLKGLGIATILTSLINLTVVGITVIKKFGIFYYRSTNQIIFILILNLVIISVLSTILRNQIVRYSVSSLIFLMLLIYINWHLKRIMKIDIISFMTKKLKINKWKSEKH